IRIEKNWLEFEIVDLIRYGIGRTNLFKLMDENNNELCVCRFVKEYDKFGSLIRYFQYEQNCIYSSNIFGKIMKIQNTSE
ncbi:MAG TPA: hypothetical protein VFV86_03730, partial [Nitrososphaeraceae archaeon]|nr:hypothetical protein [Nitrososphaeraceae archaeon]